MGYQGQHIDSQLGPAWSVVGIALERDAATDEDIEKVLRDIDSNNEKFLVHGIPLSP